MTKTIKSHIANANHSTVLGINKPLEQLACYSSEALNLYHDFIRHNGKNWLHSKKNQLGELLLEAQQGFRERCEGLAEWLIENYEGGEWKVNEDGVYCPKAAKKDRFMVTNPTEGKYYHSLCNPLEAGFVVTVHALKALINQSAGQLKNSMSFFLAYLMAILEEQKAHPEPAIDAEKVLKLIAR